MKKRTLNTESTVKERLRLVIGTIASVSGFFTLAVIGALTSYSDMTVWIVGLVLLVGGLLIANSMKLVEFISGL